MKKYNLYRNKKVFSYDEIKNMEYPYKIKEDKTLDIIVSESGKCYNHINGDNYFEISKRIIFGYEYITTTDINKVRKNYRVNRIVAKAFLEKPDGCDIVGHWNNIKHDNRVDNLYWTTTSENTKKAYDDGISDIVNRREIVAYNTVSKEVYEYKSIKECQLATKSGRSTIFRHLGKCFGRTKLRQNYRFAYKEDYIKNGINAFYL